MNSSPIKLAVRLLFNGLRFRCLKLTGKMGKPQALSIEITHRCIARCVMCNIWKIPSDIKDIEVKKWLEVLSEDLFSDLRELDITGGEPFLVSDLPFFLLGISKLKDRNLRNLKSIAITTNGFLTLRIREVVSEILPGLRDKNIDLVVVCAMDAVGPLHEKIRNYKNAWPRVNDTVEELINLRERFPNIIIGLKTTVLPMNVDELKQIAHYAEARGMFTIISPCIITKGRYLNEDRAADLAFTPQQIKKMVNFYESNMFKWSFHGRSLVGYYKKGFMRKPCSCGFNYFFIRSSGDVYPCPLVPITLGNVAQIPLEQILSSREASRFRRKVGHFPECRRCTEPGLERYALAYEGFTYLSLMFKMRFGEFNQLHTHMGLEKYFD